MCINTRLEIVDLKNHFITVSERVFGHRNKAFPRLPERNLRGASLISVPMARRKHLFSSRTQKLSSPAAIILRKWETSTVPNYIEKTRIGSFLYNSFFRICHFRSVRVAGERRIILGGERKAEFTRAFPRRLCLESCLVTGYN